MSDTEDAAPEWPGGGLMWQAILAAAQQFVAGGRQGAAAGMPPGDATSDRLALLAGLLKSPGAAAGTADDNAGRLAVEFLGQASLIAMASGFRYWRRLMRLFDQHAALGGRLGLAGTQALSEEEQRLLAEEVRGLAREVGDAASQEGRRFALEMELLGLTLATPPDAPPDAPPNNSPRRRKRVKA